MHENKIDQLNVHPLTVSTSTTSSLIIFTTAQDPTKCLRISPTQSHIRSDPTTPLFSPILKNPTRFSRSASQSPRIPKSSRNEVRWSCIHRTHLTIQERSARTCRAGSKAKLTNTTTETSSTSSTKEASATLLTTAAISSEPSTITTIDQKWAPQEAEDPATQKSSTSVVAKDSHTCVVPLSEENPKRSQGR